MAAISSGEMLPIVITGDFRMGKPTASHVAVSQPEHIGLEKQTRGSETSQYPEEKKTMSDSRSSGERTGRSLNQCHESGIGVAGPREDFGG